MMDLNFEINVDDMKPSRDDDRLFTESEEEIEEFIQEHLRKKKRVTPKKKKVKKLRKES